MGFVTGSGFTRYLLIELDRFFKILTDCGGNSVDVKGVELWQRCSTSSGNAQQFVFGSVDVIQINQSLSQTRMRKDVAIIRCNGPLQSLARLIRSPIAQRASANVIPPLSLSRRRMRRGPTESES